MLTIHAGTGGHAVAVDGTLVEAAGPLAELTGRYPAARVRDWPGAIGPGRLHEGPAPDAPSPRERVHALLRLGVTAVAPDTLTAPGLREAAARAGLPVAAAPAPLLPGARADLAVFDACGTCVATVLAGRVVHRRA